jgi:hypothetical protein
MRITPDTTTQELQGVGLQVVQRSLLMDRVPLQITVIEWGCSTLGCDGEF